MKGIFFDACATMLAKNLLPIAKVMSENEVNFSATFVSAQTGGNIDPRVESDSIKKINVSGYKYESVTTFNVSVVMNFLKRENPDFLFIGAYRIYDQLWVSICKSLGVKVFSQQHGFEVESVYYHPNVFYKKAGKVLRLTYAAYSLAKTIKRPFVILYFQYCRYILTGTSLANTLLDNTMTRPDVAFVYSQFYKKFWNKKYGFPMDSMQAITPTDFSLIKKILKKKQENTLCYITQTLVEDGRMSINKFYSLLESYKTIASHVDKFIVKLHPQANEDIYHEIFDTVKNVEYTREFPHSTYYLTHYSSLAYTASFISNNVILQELSGHPTPEIFRKASFPIFHNVTEIIDYIKRADVSKPNLEERKKALQYFAIFKEDDSPHNEIYKRIKKYLLKSTKSKCP